MIKLLKLENLATLRTVVGYLGEKEQYAWWQSSFLGTGSRSFLAPVFGRTMLLAQVTGITSAAARVHDEYIGVGDTYHLFRLPEDLEQSMHEFFASPEPSPTISAWIKSRETALSYLQEIAPPATTGIGPVHVGNLEAIRSAAAWESAAAHYAQAFLHSTQSFPYFADRA